MNPVSTDTQDTDTEKAERAIVRVLRDYPNISRSMLGLHVRPAYKSWSTVLERLIECGIVIQEPVIRDSGRAAVIYRLASNVTPVPESESSRSSHN